jgi:hypothetical protein
MADTKDTKGAGSATDQKKKTGVLKYLDNTFSDDGLKTDVKITITNGTVLQIVGASVAATALSTLTYFLIKGIFTRINKA